MVRGLWTALGIVAAALGLVGLALPVMPTVPFMIVAAFAFGRGSPRLRRWTIEHPTFGPPVRRWEEDGAISRRHKAYAVIGMAGSMGLGLLLGLPATGAGGAGGLPRRGDGLRADPAGRPGGCAEPRRAHAARRRLALAASGKTLAGLSSHSGRRRP